MYYGKNCNNLISIKYNKIDYNVGEEIMHHNYSINPFDYISLNLSKLLKQTLSFQLTKEKTKYSKRKGYSEFLNKLTEICENENTNIKGKIEELSKKKYNCFSKEQLLEDYIKILDDKQINVLKKLFITIPNNQQKKLLIDVLTKNEGKILDNRNYIVQNIELTKNSKTIIKLTTIDQGLFELFLLTKILKKQIVKNKQSNNILIDFILLTIKLNAYSNDKLKQNEIEETIAEISNNIILDKNEKEEYSSYIKILTSD
jgi:hypothetical protein